MLHLGSTRPRTSHARRFAAVSLVLALATTAVVACKTPGGASRVKEDVSAPAADASAAAGGDLSTYPGPPGVLPPAENFALWSQYCKGVDGDPSVLPQPNYENADVAKAAGILSQMAEHSFALYSQIKYHYKNAMASKPENVTQMGHEFLVYLCGEFRDRAGMVKAKIEWIHRTNYLQPIDQPQIDPKKEVWSQMTAAAYQPYLDLSLAYYNAKFAALQSKGKHDFGNEKEIDKPVTPLSVCETKFMFAEYIDEGKEFDSLATFNQKYEPFKTENCTADDTDYYYDFRGDGNFKPNSPESNGMIWHAISTVLQCKSTTKKLDAPKYPDQKLILTDEDCKNYFAKPFASRWNGARAGLATWMLHSRELDDTMKNAYVRWTVYPNWGKDLAKEAHLWNTEAGDGQLVSGWQKGYGKGDLGLYALTGAGEADPKTQQFIYERLRNAVDRHTQWYKSGYDDKMSQKRERTEAYSPFVASSYEMSASAAFVAPCYTIPCNGDVPARHWKHFMFIFKVHKDRYYSTDDLAAGRKLDFDRNWFDETTFGTTSLAKAEHAWDRLGTALEDELDSILYLHHICSNGQLEKPGVKCEP